MKDRKPIKILAGIATISIVSLTILAMATERLIDSIIADEDDSDRDYSIDEAEYNLE